MQYSDYPYYSFYSQPCEVCNLLAGKHNLIAAITDVKAVVFHIFQNRENQFGWILGSNFLDQKKLKSNPMRK